MAHRTPLSTIEAVSSELTYATTRGDIEARLALNGTDPRCVGCHSKCKQIATTDHDTAWECWRNPGPLTKSYWLRRLVGAREAAQMRRTRGIGGVARSPRSQPRPEVNNERP